jgi:hypothetical protein
MLKNGEIKPQDVLDDRSLKVILEDILDEFCKLNKVTGAIKGLGDIQLELVSLGCPHNIIQNVEAMIDDWKKIYWYGSLDSINWDETLKKISTIKSTICTNATLQKTKIENKKL